MTNVLIWGDEMTKKVIRLGMIGCSQILPRAIINPSKEVDNLVLYGIASRNSFKAQRYANEYNILHSFNSYDELLMCDEIDCIYISLPNHLHAEWIIKALRANKHILVEKPMCLNYKDFSEIEKSYHNAGVQLLEGVMVQHHPWQSKINDIIKSDQYGKLQKINTKICIVPKGDLKENYRSDPEKGGGSFYDLSCYWLQFLQNTTTLELQSYKGESNFSGPNGSDLTFNAKIILENNIEASFTSSFEKPYKVEHILEFEKAVIKVSDFFRACIGQYKINIKIKEITGHEEKISLTPQNYYTNQLKYFLDVIYGDAPNIPIQLSGQRIKIMEDIYITAKKNS